MMTGLFAVFFLCLILIYREKHQAAFALIVVNLILSFLLLLHHTTDILSIW